MLRRGPASGSRKRWPCRLLPLLALLAACAACRSTPGAVVWNLELVTNPSPPVADAPVQFRCLLSTAAGVPLDGGAAVLRLTPAAGVAAAAAPAPLVLAPRGHGIYDGEGSFPAPGAWTATLTLSRQQRSEIRQFPLSVRPPRP